MTDHPALVRLRAIALALPETGERLSDGRPTFHVAGNPFARLDDDGIGLLSGDDWISLRLEPDSDWDQIADRVAASWELAAPRALLEAGGR